MKATLASPRFRAKQYGTDKILVERIFGVHIIRVGESHIAQKKVVVSVWRGKSRSACRYHASVEVRLEDGTVCSGSGSFQAGSGSEWVEGSAIFAAMGDAGICLEWESDKLSVFRGDVHAAIVAIGRDILGQELVIIE